MQKIVLWSCIALLPILLVATYFIRENPETTLKHRSEAMPERVITPRRGSVTPSRRNPNPMPEQIPPGTPADTVLNSELHASMVRGMGMYNVHRERAQERVEELRKESLDESFIRLQDDQSYISESILTGVINPKIDLQRMFSNRGFLKVFQQFKELPYKQAVGKINESWKRAVEEYAAGTDLALLSHDLAADPTAQEQYEELDNVLRSPQWKSGFSEKCTFYVPMLLAAYLGENTLLVDMIDEAHHLTDTRIDRLEKCDTIPQFTKDFILPEDPDGMLPPMSLEENALLSILIYAAERSGVDLSEADIPFESFTQMVIPLFPWDDEWTHYDYPVFRSGVVLDPKNADELFTVYMFPRFRRQGERFFDYQERLLIIDTLKEILSR